MSAEAVAVKKLVTHLHISRKVIAQLKRQVGKAQAEIRELDSDKQQLLGELHQCKAALEDIRYQLRSNLSELEDDA
jgi:chromosome segregation ATPase